MNFFQPQSCSFLQKRWRVSEYLLLLGSLFPTSKTLLRSSRLLISEKFSIFHVNLPYRSEGRGPSSSPSLQEFCPAGDTPAPPTTTTPSPAPARPPEEALP